MDIMAVDLGGTRLKIGARSRGSKWKVEILPSPETLDSFCKEISFFWHLWRPQKWGLALPGKVAPDGSKIIRSSARFGGDGMSANDFASLFRSWNVPAPDLLTSDSSAMAFGLLGSSGSGTVAQISTGLGARVIAQGELLIDPDNPELMMLASVRGETWIAPDGMKRTFQEWGGWRPAQEWLPPELRGMPLHELALLDHPSVDLIVDALSAWLIAVRAASPAPDPFWVGGGGALAFRERLRERIAKERDFKMKFPADAQTPGLDGIAILIGDKESYKN